MNINVRIVKYWKFLEYFRGFASCAESNISTQKLYEKFKNDIHFSSVIEAEKIKYSYKRIKILQSKNIKEKRLKINEFAKIKAFPLGVQLVDRTLTPPEYNNNDDERDIKYNHYTRENDSNSSATISAPIVNWMQDYEFYDENDEHIDLQGTADPSIRISKVPCSGCGAFLHCTDIGLPGFIPSEIFRNRTEQELKRIICQRCHFLKEYNVALDVEVSPNEYMKIISSIKDKFALAILMIDLLDFPCSIPNDIAEILGPRRPVFVVGNKVDLLPKDSRGYLAHIKDCLTKSIVNAGLSELSIKHVCLISAKTGYGVEELITKLQNMWRYKGDVYLLGCTNVGKSSLFNALLGSDYCKIQARDLIQRATACPWPGTTFRLLKFPILRPSDIRIYQRTQRLLSERALKVAEEKLRKEQMKSTGKIKYATLVGHIGCTFSNVNSSKESFSMASSTNPVFSINENSKEYVSSKWCFDTPGVMHQDQILSLLTIEELLLTLPTRMITPRSYLLKPGMTLFLAGLGRLDFIRGSATTTRITVYSSSNLPILIVATENAEKIYNELLGSDLLAVPRGSEHRLQKWIKLEKSDEITVEGKKSSSSCDIILSSAGWLGLNIAPEKYAIFEAWTPGKRGIFKREPSLIPYGEKLRGKRVRDTLAYRIGKPFILK